MPVRTITEIRLHTAHQATGLWQLGEPNPDGSDPPPPYWAFPWAGGMALARFILDRPESVAGRRVLDLGAGSGLVAIAAAKAGARHVIAAEIDRYAIAALGLNALANGAAVVIVTDDLTDDPPPAGFLSAEPGSVLGVMGAISAVRVAVAPDLPTDRRWRPTQLTSDPTNAPTGSEQVSDRDPLLL